MKIRLKTKRISRPGLADSKIHRVSKTSISDEIVQQIMALIANGDLPPGSRLPSERELCKKFGAGRSSLREALRCLAIVGVLNARVGEGTSVALDGEKFLGKIVEWRLITEQHDIENLMEVRIALEAVAVAHVATRGLDTDIARLEDLLEKMELIGEHQKRFAKLDLDFHVAIAKASENTLLFDLISMIRGQLANGLARVLHSPDAIPRSLEEHRSIVDAIRHQDPAAASRRMRSHLENGTARYRSAVQSEAERTPSAGDSKPIARKMPRRRSTPGALHP